MKRIKNIKRNGFTLIELMVVIAIIAILAIVGITIFSGQQASARDSRRTGDIQAIAKALENHFVASTDANSFCVVSGTNTSITAPGYCPLQASWFAGATVPTDPSGSSQDYCLYYATQTGSITVANDVTTQTSRWGTTCPAAPSGYTLATALPDFPPISSGTPSNLWLVCAQKEAAKDASGKYLDYCQVSSQQ